MFKNHYVEKSQTKKNVVYDSWNNTLTKWILKAYYPLNRCRKDHWQNPTSIHDKTLSKQCMLLLSHFSRVRLCATPWTAAYQASPSMGFSRQEYWSGLPFPSPRIYVLKYSLPTSQIFKLKKICQSGLSWWLNGKEWKIPWRRK